MTLLDSGILEILEKLRPQPQDMNGKKPTILVLRQTEIKVLQPSEKRPEYLDEEAQRTAN
jgi:hypothetical protein